MLLTTPVDITNALAAAQSHGDDIDGRKLRVGHLDFLEMFALIHAYLTNSEICLALQTETRGRTRGACFTKDARVIQK